MICSLFPIESVNSSSCHPCKSRDPQCKIDFKAPGSLIKSGMTTVRKFCSFREHHEFFYLIILPIDRCNYRSGKCHLCKQFIYRKTISINLPLLLVRLEFLQIEFLHSDLEVIQSMAKVHLTKSRMEQPCSQWSHQINQ